MHHRLSCRQWLLLIAGTLAMIAIAVIVGSQLAAPQNRTPVVRLLESDSESLLLPLDLTGDHRFSAFRPSRWEWSFQYRSTAEEVQAQTKYLGHLGADYFMITWNGASGEGRRIVGLKDRDVVVCRARRIQIVVSPSASGTPWEAPLQ